MYLVIAISSLAVSVHEVVAKPNSFSQATWHLASAGLAGYVVVYWSLYQSSDASFVALGVVATIFASILMLYWKDIAKVSPRLSRRPFKIGLVLAFGFFIAVSSLAAVLNVAGKPFVTVSPSSTLVSLNSPGQNNAQIATVRSAYAGAWGFVITANTNGSLVVHINNTIGGPVELPFLERDRAYPLNITIETPPRPGNHTYLATLNWAYQDFADKTYTNSQNITVTIGKTTLPPRTGLNLPSATVIAGAAVEVLAVGSIAYFAFSEIRKLRASATLKTAAQGFLNASSETLSIGTKNILKSDS